jgi:hypothetical protein
MPDNLWEWLKDRWMLLGAVCFGIFWMKIEIKCKLIEKFLEKNGLNFLKVNGLILFSVFMISFIIFICLITLILKRELQDGFEKLLIIFNYIWIFLIVNHYMNNDIEFKNLNDINEYVYLLISFLMLLKQRNLVNSGKE